MVVSSYYILLYCSSPTRFIRPLVLNGTASSLDADIAVRVLEYRPPQKNTSIVIHLLCDDYSVLGVAEVHTHIYGEKLSSCIGDKTKLSFQNSIQAKEIEWETERH